MVTSPAAQGADKTALTWGVWTISPLGGPFVAGLADYAVILKARLPNRVGHGYRCVYDFPATMLVDAEFPEFGLSGQLGKTRRPNASSCWPVPKFQNCTV